MTKTIAFVVYEGLTVLDLVGPLQALSGLTAFNADSEVVTVGERLGPVGTDTPLSIAPNLTFADVPAPYGIVVPGGTEPTFRAMADETLLGYLRAAAASAEFVASVCTGSLLLGAAGLLEGRRATSHWMVRDRLSRLGAVPVAERWIEDGPVITAAGVAAGIDMALHLIERLTDADTARMVQLGIEYDPRPPHGPIDWSAVDIASWAGLADAQLAAALADHPALLDRMTG